MRYDPQPPAGSAAALTWLAVVLALATLLGLAIWAVERGRGDLAPPPSPHPSPSPSPSPTRDPNVFRLAGSGTNLPLVRTLAHAFANQASCRPLCRPMVHESIGSNGGIDAIRDGVIDIGLSSRPLRPVETRSGLQAFPYARVAIVFATSLDVPHTDLTRRSVLDLYSGRQPSWSTGDDVMVFLREATDSGNRTAYALIPGFAAVEAALRDANPWRVLYRDREMQDALLGTPGSIGLFDQGAIVSQRLPLRVLAFNGVTPSPATLTDGSYTLQKTLAFVLPSAPSSLARDFIAFAYSPAGRRYIEDGGYLALPPPPPFTRRKAP